MSKLPKTYKGILSLLIKIAEHGNDYTGKFSEEEELTVGTMIAEIQNSLGEMEPLLTRLKLSYNSLPALTKSLTIKTNLTNE